MGDILEQRKELWEQGLTIFEMAERCGISKAGMHNYIVNHRNEFGYRNQKKAYSHESDKVKSELAQMKTWWDKGVSVKAIANRLGISERAVSYRMQRRRDMFPPRDAVQACKLRTMLRKLLAGVDKELCMGRDSYSCERCAMHRGNLNCTVTDAMELVGMDDVVADMVDDIMEMVGVSNA